MTELEQLLQEAGATSEQIGRAHAIFEAQNRPALDVKPVALEPTIRQSVDLRNRTSLQDSLIAVNPNESKTPDNRPRLGRYIDLGLLGKGGMGEVRRVLDPDLNRRLAMKIIHPEFLKLDISLSRFVEEAQVVAQLQHPNIIPIHELGQLDDGRLYFTMKEVQGRPLSDLIAEVHSASTEYVWMPSEEGWTFRRLMQVFSQVCAATAFAHSRGVVHRDLKPENILIGQFDEVLVVDWGIAKIVEHLRSAQSSESLPVQSNRTASHLTRMGEVAGTPAYMAPEQARGQIDRIDARSDIYALGAVLYEILSGRCPYGGTSSEQVLSKVILGPPPSVRTTVVSTERVTGTIELDFFDAFDDVEDEVQVLDSHNEQGARLPDELVAACEKAMQRQPETRYSQVSELQRVVLDWIDGAKKRDQALEIINETQSIASQLSVLSDQEGALRSQSEQAKADLSPWATTEEWSPSWSLEDRANQTALDATLLSTRREQLLQGALTHVADLEEAHSALLEEHQARHAKAERAKDEMTAAKARMAMEYHSAQLPFGHASRESAAAYLKGTGLLSLATETPGAAVYCSPFELVNRRLVKGEETLIGHTPLLKHAMPMGSYSLRLSQSGCHDVIYPVNIVRQGHWSGATPDGIAPPIWMPPLGTLSENECYIPCGPFVSGGDPFVPEGLDEAKIWVPGFIIQRFPVTYADYQHYLQALLDAGRHEDFAAALPVRDQAASGSSGRSCFENVSGRVDMVEDATGMIPELAWPIAFVNFRQSVHYAEWKSETTGQEWKLLNEFEWEKAARGVDGRVYPWGNAFTPSWANIELSQEVMSPVDVTAHPVDCSVYGVRGMGGNLCQWTSSEWETGMMTTGYIHVPEQTPVDVTGKLRTFKGGCWMFADVFTRSSNRIGFHETDGVSHVGFRVGRSLPNSD